MPDVSQSGFPAIPSAAGTIVVVAAGADWLVVDKPCGLSIHNDPGLDLCSLVQQAGVQGRLPLPVAENARLDAVHRLDRDTSGIVLLATGAKRLAFFGEQFARRRVDKRYLALVHGRPQGTVGPDGWARWSRPLSKAAGGRRDPAGRGPRQACATDWRILESSPHYSLIECRLQTGRKHQIRRHARLAGHAIVGDRRYGSRRSLAYLERQCGFVRLGLHAHKLTLGLPDREPAQTVASAGLPPEMQALLDSDR